MAKDSFQRLEGRIVSQAGAQYSDEISGDFQKFMPCIKPGKIINSDYNPVCYRSA